MKQEFRLARQEFVFPALGSLLTLFTLCHMCLNLLINPLNAELNANCHLLTLLRAHHILRVSRTRVNKHNVTHPLCSSEK